MAGDVGIKNKKNKMNMKNKKPSVKFDGFYVKRDTRIKYPVPIVILEHF